MVVGHNSRRTSECTKERKRDGIMSTHGIRRAATKYSDSSMASVAIHNASTTVCHEHWRCRKDLVANGRHRDGESTCDEEAEEKDAAACAPPKVFRVGEKAGVRRAWDGLQEIAVNDSK